MYHMQLRQFPFNACRFNLSEHDLLALLDPWVRDKWIEMDERKWNPQHARITVLEGPQLVVQELTMGRGWRSAERQSKDVTEQMLERASALVAHASTDASAGAHEPAPTARRLPVDVEAPRAAGGPAAGRQAAPEIQAGGERLGDAGAGGGPAGDADAELRALLGDDPDGLLQAWQLVVRLRPELTPSESLALAEQTLRSLS
jgi:hypothetical protein